MVDHFKSTIYEIITDTVHLVSHECLKAETSYII